MDYKQCWDLQRSLFDALIARKSEARSGVAVESDESIGTVLMVEHPAVYTLGKNGKESNLLLGEEYLRSIGADFYRIDRGGDVTFHGEGQIVGYPILDIERLGIGLRDYIDALEQSVIDTIAHYGIVAGRVAGASGVWLGSAEERNLRKICAIGVRASRFITMHGFALNVTTDLRYFNHINPCGFTDRGVTSMERELGSAPD
ncbi:MAG: lipoyl(octanoyl) transferase LipB, partial [Alistipes sp.]|nr:lipoyl(octanoyl) transferase LipB [Alistipes sp.]